ncbi:MAG: ABC transporter ATP-binding protein [Planctomycetaceae bacterium]
MNSADLVISIEQLAKTYRSTFWSGRAISALRGVTLQTQRGEIFGLLGPNGAGKTTLIKILLGVLRASSGTATVFGQPAGSMAARIRVGYLPESLRVDRHHTAQTALRYYGKISRMDSHTIESRMGSLLKLVGLEGRDREPVRRFSKGMYQRLGLAQALLHDPDLLILDEPTDGLDPVGRSEVRRLLVELKQRGKTIFLNSHILQEVELVCDRVAIMSGGQVRGVGSIDELTRHAGGGGVVFDIARDGSTLPQAHQDTAAQVRDLLEPIYRRPDAAPLSLQVDAMPEQRCRVRAIGDDQSCTDAAIDALRQNGWSILGVKTSRAGLEEVFLSLVALPEMNESTVSLAGTDS